MRKKISIMVFLLVVMSFALISPIYSSNVQPVGEGKRGGPLVQQESGGIVDDDDILNVPPGETYTLHGVHRYNCFVGISGTLYVTDYDGTAETGTLALYAPEISISGSINADGRGWRRNEGPGHALLNDMDGGAGGAGYGGSGGDGGGSPGDGGPSYGNASTFEIQKGSGGSDSHGGTKTWLGGDGGGSILLHGDSVIIVGSVTSNGNKGQNGVWAAGGGSGGGILIHAGIVKISGTLSVEGGGGGSGTWGGGGGGGGRIKIFYSSLDTTGSTITYGGGSGGSGSPSGQPGEAGTYFTIFKTFTIPSIDVTYGTKPTVDGIISSGEWVCANSVTFATSGGTCTVYFKHDGTTLYVAFDVPNKDANSGVQVFVDTEYDRATLPQTDDYRFTISRRTPPDEYGENQGTGTGWTAWGPPIGWTGAHQDLASTWNAEFSIPYAKLGITAGVAKTIGISFWNAWTSTGDHHWPSDANWTDPSTWGAAYSSDNWSHDVTIQAYCMGTPISVSITMDGSPTGYNTPHTFINLAGTHTFTVPSTDLHGHPFAKWSTGETSTTITVTSPGTYAASYVFDYVPGPWDGTIKIGVIGPMPWIQGQGIAEGAQLAADQINAGGPSPGIEIGWNNYRVQIVPADTLRGMPVPTGTTGVAAASEFVAAGCQFVIGGFRGEAIYGIREVLMDYKKIYFITGSFLGGAATNELVDDGTGANPKTVRSNYDRYKYVFRNWPMNLTMILNSIASFQKYAMMTKLMPIYTWGAPAPQVDETDSLKIAVISEIDDTCTDVLDSYLSDPDFWNNTMELAGPHPLSGKLMGGIDVVYHARVASFSSDFKWELTQVKESGAQLIIHLFWTPSGRTFIKQWSSMGVDAVPVGISEAALEIPTHWTATWGDCEYETVLAVTGTENPINARTLAFWNAYKAKYGHPPIHTSYAAYDAVIALEQMLELGPDFIDYTADDPDWWDPSQPVGGLIPYIEAMVRDGSTMAWDYCLGAMAPNTGLLGKFRYTGPCTRGIHHDVQCGPTVNCVGQNDATESFWIHGWTRALVGQWQYNTLHEEGRLEVTFPLDKPYSTKWKIPPWMYPLAETDIYINGVVDVMDLGVIGMTWQSTPSDPAWIAGGQFYGLLADMNYDKKITIADASVVAKDFGKNVANFGLPWPLGDP